MFSICYNNPKNIIECQYLNQHIHSSTKDKIVTITHNFVINTIDKSQLEMIDNVQYIIFLLNEQHIEKETADKYNITTTDKHNQIIIYDVVDKYIFDQIGQNDAINRYYKVQDNKLFKIKNYYTIGHLDDNMTRYFNSLDKFIFHHIDADSEKKCDTYDYLTDVNSVYFIYGFSPSFLIGKIYNRYYINVWKIDKQVVSQYEILLQNNIPVIDYSYENILYLIKYVNKALHSKINYMPYQYNDEINDIKNKWTRGLKIYDVMIYGKSPIVDRLKQNGISIIEANEFDEHVYHSKIVLFTNNSYDPLIYDKYALAGIPIMTENNISNDLSHYNQYDIHKIVLVEENNTCLQKIISILSDYNTFMNSYNNRYTGQIDIIKQKRAEWLCAFVVPNVYDSFIFFDELDMLKLRLEELDDLVDYHILVEAKRTFTNEPKELYYNNNKHLFKKYNSKIIHLTIDDFDNVKDNDIPWNCEYYQRDYAVNHIRNNLSIADVILHGDVDEFPKVDAIKHLIYRIGLNTIYRLEMDFYYYNFNWMMDNKWFFFFICRVCDLMNTTLTDYRIRYQIPQFIKEAGWHMSYFMTPQRIQRKLETFSHQEYNNGIFKNSKWINHCIDTGTSIFAKDLKHGTNKLIKNNDTSNLPKTYNKFNDFLKIVVSQDK